jgi:nucleotide-binding universal stress UspA family protein
MKIVLTTDGSKNAEKALAWFSRLPIAKAGELTVITVAASPAASAYAGYIDPDFGKQEKENAAKAYSRASDLLSQEGCSSVHVCRVGHAAHEILQYAREVAADLIVIGARGNSSLQRIFLGSTSDAVATHASCSVLVVRHPDDSSLGKSPFHITCAYDGSESSKETILQLAATKWPEGSELNLVNCIQHPALLDADIPYDRYLTESMRQSLEDAGNQLASNFASVSQHVLEEVHVGESILNFANESKADLIAIGDTGQSAISRFFVGSVSRFVLHHAHCTVWLTRKKS